MIKPQTPVAPDPSRRAPPPLRQDLVERHQRHLGRAYHILKNPLSLAYFRLPAPHLEAARRFDGTTPLALLLPVLRSSSRYWRSLPEPAALEELSALANQLAAAGLLRVPAPGAEERARRLRESKKNHRLETWVGHAVYFKKSLFDPDDLLNRITPAFAWIFTPACLLLLAGCVLFTLWVVLGHADRLHASSANFFTLQNLISTWLLFIGVKVVHEFGHAITCKRFGGEVHEMGFMFILFTPYLFCNVSDSWLAEKRQRIAVTAAGMLVEILLACIAAWGWFATQPGLLHQLCFNTMVLCSVSTVLFNGNPLMKFDGYYILTDLLEIPNLRAKSNAWVTAWAQRHLLGIAPKTALPDTREIGPVFGVYAVAAYLYGWFLTFAIAGQIFDILKPHGLEILSRTYVGLFLFVSLGLPFLRLLRSVKSSGASILTPRARWIALSALGCTGVLFLIPFTERVTRSAVLEHPAVHHLSPPIPATLTAILATEGQVVKKGDVLASMESRPLEARLADLAFQREAAHVRLRAAIASGTEEARLLVPVQEKHLREIEEELHALEARRAALQLLAPSDGIVRTPRTYDLVGRVFSPGQAVLSLGALPGDRVLIPLDEKQAKRVHAGQEVEFYWDALPHTTGRGRIAIVHPGPSEYLPAPGLANLFGGDVPAEIDPATGQPRPSIPVYEAEAVLDEPLALRPQATGRACITTARSTLGSALKDRILDLLNPDWRL